MVFSISAPLCVKVEHSVEKYVEYSGSEWHKYFDRAQLKMGAL